MTHMRSLLLCLHLLLSAPLISCASVYENTRGRASPAKFLNIQKDEKEISPDDVTMPFTPVNPNKKNKAVESLVTVKSVNSNGDSESESDSDYKLENKENVVRNQSNNVDDDLLMAALEDFTISEPDPIKPSPFALQTEINSYKKFLSLPASEQAALGMAFANMNRGVPSVALSPYNQLFRLARHLRLLNGKVYPQAEDLFKPVAFEKLTLNDAIALAELYALLDHPQLAHQALTHCNNDTVKIETSNDFLDAHFNPKASDSKTSMPLLLASNGAYKLLELYLQNQVTKQAEAARLEAIRREKAKRLAHHEMSTLKDLLSDCPNSQSILSLYRQAHNLLQ